MRPRGSIIGQLLVAFCLFAVLMGAAAVVGYIAVTGRGTAAKQLTRQYAALQEADGQLQTAFSSGDSAITHFASTYSFYTAAGRSTFLARFGRAHADFDRDMVTLRLQATPSVRGPIQAQDHYGTQLFALAPTAVSVTPRPSAAAALLSKSSLLAGGFSAAATVTQQRLRAAISEQKGASRRTLTAGLAWSAASLAAAVLLVLAVSLSTLYTITRPLRRVTATVHRLTEGDHSARAPVAGSPEVRQVAGSVNALADASDRLRAQEAESNRLRAMSREAGLRIREHLVAGDVLDAGRLAVEQILDTDIVYLRLVENDRLSTAIGRVPPWLIPADVIRTQMTDAVMDNLRRIFRAQTSMVIQDIRGPEGDQVPPDIRETVRKAGAVRQLLTPFGVGGEMLGMIVAQRMVSDRRWTPAEVDAMESVAADLGRGLNHARLYEAENRLVEDLKALDLAKSSFFAAVSHELRAPLTTIEGYVEMFGDGEAGEVTPQQRQMLETIDRSTVRLRNLVEDLFMLAKLESGAFTTVRRPVDLAGVITGAAEAVRPSVLAGGLTLTLSGAGCELMVDGDAGQLDRVMINLLSNAVKFTPKGGRIGVASRAEGGSAVVRVTDTGIGVPAGDQKELFNRFFRASNATGRSIPGTGLGLAIVRMIVVNHDGDIELQSLEGAGTTVTVRLPLLARAEPVGAAAEVLRPAGHQVGHGIAQRGEARSGGRAGIGQ
jgi:two-component system phosphate regulon sensor histidine kinase PhoR